MDYLKRRKLELEKELEEINEQLSNQSKLDEILEVVAVKLRKVQEVLPALSFEIHHNPYNNTLSIREYALNNGLKYYEHDINCNNVEESLAIFDDMLNNPDKYIERYKIITRLVSKIKIEDAYVASGSVVYYNKEAIPTDASGHAYQIAEARCVFTEDNYLNVKFHVMYEQLDDISENYEMTLDGFKFKVHVQLEDLDSLDFTNDYECKLEKVNPKDLPSIIKKLKNATCNHNVIVNFKNVVSGY